jgi:hypothetical protein
MQKNVHSYLIIVWSLNYSSRIITLNLESTFAIILSLSLFSENLKMDLIGWGCEPVVEYIPTMHKILDLNASI